MTDVLDAPSTPLGKAIKRTEDPRFITGEGRYLDDIKLQSMTHMAILRSPYAHANIRSVDTSAAADDARRHRPSSSARTSRTTRCRWPGRPAAARASRTTSARPRILATDSVKWTGEGVAAVVAETGGPGLRRARGDRRRLGAAARRRRRREGDRRRRAAAPRERPEQRRVRVDRRRQGRHRCGRRRRRGRRPPADRQPAAHPQPDGDPRRHRLVQPGHRRVHDLDVEPDAAHPAAAAGRLRDGHPGAQDPLHQPGRRRRLRHRRSSATPTWR